VLLTGHVDVVATFRNDIQSEAGEDGESNSNFPHEFSPKINSISLIFFNWGQSNINFVNLLGGRGSWGLTICGTPP
jgi:hypothetical protein